MTPETVTLSSPPVSYPPGYVESVEHLTVQLRKRGKPKSVPEWRDWLSDGLRLLRLLYKGHDKQTDHVLDHVLSGDAAVQQFCEHLASGADDSDAARQQVLVWARSLAR